MLTADTVTAEQDIRRWAPSDEQMRVAEAMLRAAGGAFTHVLVPIALPGKREGWWEVGQRVVPLPGYWACPNQYGTAYGDAREEADAAAARWLQDNDETGVTSYATIHIGATTDEARFACFEGIRAAVPRTAPAVVAHPDDVR